jgi:hypothetical protein
MPHRPEHPAQTAPGTGMSMEDLQRLMSPRTAPGTGQFHQIGREGSGPGILEKIMAIFSGRSRTSPDVAGPLGDTAEDAYRVFAPPVNEPRLDLEVRRPVLQAGPHQWSQLQPEMQGQEGGDAGTGALLESIAAMLQNPEFLAMETEGPIPHAFEAARQLEEQRNEPERLLRQLLDKHAAQMRLNTGRGTETRGVGLDLIREGGPALEARDRSRVGRPRFTPSRTGITQADIMRGGPSIRFDNAGTIHGQSTARSRRESSRPHTGRNLPSLR